MTQAEIEERLLKAEGAIGALKLLLGSVNSALPKRDRRASAGKHRSVRSDGSRAFNAGSILGGRNYGPRDDHVDEGRSYCCFTAQPGHVVAS